MSNANPTSAELLAHFQAQVAESLETLKAFASDVALHQRVVDAAELICAQYEKGGSLFVAGNGGSAADAQHLVAELVSKLNKDRTPIRAFALTVDTSILTAIGNDYGYKHTFSRQVRGLMRANDVLLAITTSGNSENILEAVAACKEVGAKCILLSAGSGGKAAGLCDLELLAPTRKTPRTQELHLVLYHNLCELIEKRLVGKGLCKYL